MCHKTKLSQEAVDFLLFHVSDASSSSAGSLISFQLIPNHIRGISLHFLTLSYGGGCFLGAFLIQLAYFLSGGTIYTYTNVMWTDGNTGMSLE